MLNIKYHKITRKNLQFNKTVI